MSTRSAADPQVHLHWVRETPSRALEVPASQVLDSLDSLPPSVRTAVRASGQPVVELHLPPFRPETEDSSLSAWCADLTFHTDAGGRLVATRLDDPDPAATLAFHHAMILIFRAVTGDRTPLTLVAEPAPSALLPQPAPEVYRCLAGGLATAPAERTGPYFESYKAISIVFQTRLREWLPPAHIDSLEVFDPREGLAPLLVWSVANPINGRSVDQLAVDVLDTRQVQRALQRVSRRLVPLLAETNAILVHHGAAPDQLAAYDPERAESILARCLATRRPLHNCFFQERRLIEGFIDFCIHLPEWRAHRAHPSRAYRAARQAWEGVEVHIRRLSTRHFHSRFGSMLLLEAVRALEAID